VEVTGVLKVQVRKSSVLEKTHDDWCTARGFFKGSLNREFIISISCGCHHGG